MTGEVGDARASGAVWAWSFARSLPSPLVGLKVDLPTEGAEAALDYGEASHSAR